MSVALDANMTGGNGPSGQCQQATGVTTITATGLTIGLAATLLTVPILLGAGGPSGVSVTWNGVSLTQGPLEQFVNSSTITAAIFYLIRPAAGNLSLTANWTGTADVYMGGQSWLGTDTSTGIVVADSQVVGDPSITQIVVPSGANDATLAVFGSNGGTGAPTNQTQLWNDSALVPSAGASYALGGSSNTHMFDAGGDTNGLAGIHILAGVSGLAFRKTLSSIGGRVGTRQLQG